jgi:hypothetical protein
MSPRRQRNHDTSMHGLHEYMHNQGPAICLPTGPLALPRSGLIVLQPLDQCPLILIDTGE